MSMNENIYLKELRNSGGMRLAVLFGAFFILLIVTSIIGGIISGLNIGDPRTQALATSVVQCLLAFCLPAFLLAKFSDGSNWSQWLELTRAPKPKALLGVLAVYLLSLPAMEWLIAWNSQLHLPESMAGLEATMRNWENANAQASQVLLDAQGWGAAISGVLIIGVLTAFSEEMFFRGGVQGIFTHGNAKPAVAVWLSAILFSTMHFQFFGFFPRLLMGVFFGYLLIWTRSLWVPVFAHALNNSMVVIIASFTGQTSGNISDESTEIIFGDPVIVISSVVLTSLLFILYRKSLFKGWQKSQEASATGM